MPGDAPIATLPGPAALGRGVVIAADETVPPPWQDAPVVTIDEAVLTDPGPTVATLHELWATRRPFVVALAVDPSRFREPEEWRVEPWTLGPEHEAWGDRLHFLVWANTYDARTGTPRWWWSTKAARLGAAPSPDGPADVTLPDGQPAWIDGGPRAPFASDAVGGHAIVHADAIELGRLAAVPASRRRRRRTSRPTNWPPSPTVPDRPASSRRPVRARPGCSPSGCATSSPTVGTSATPSSRSPTT